VSTAVRTAPANRLPDGVRRLFFWDAAIGAVMLAGIAFAIAAAVHALMPWLPLAVAAAGLAYAAVLPRKNYLRWRWELHEEELDLLHGVWSVTRTIVPITRIQHVSVERNGWIDVFGLVRLHVHTAAGATTIPGLEPAQADDVRDRILARLRTPDDL
jgi:membrane protein YdbS with pleckstrin-like domain